MNEQARQHLQARQPVTLVDTKWNYTRDLILKVDTRLSMGVWKPSSSFRFGSSERAYGTIGGWEARSASRTL